MYGHPPSHKERERGGGGGGGGGDRCSCRNVNGVRLAHTYHNNSDIFLHNHHLQMKSTQFQSYTQEHLETTAHSSIIALKSINSPYLLYL